jgi:hypothetical protein
VRVRSVFERERSVDHDVDLSGCGGSKEIVDAAVHRRPFEDGSHKYPVQRLIVLHRLP